MDPAGSFKINNPFWRLTISRELMEDKISFKSLWVTFWPLSFSSQSPGTEKKETNKHVKRLINVWKRLPRATITIKKGAIKLQSRYNKKKKKFNLKPCCTWANPWWSGPPGVSLSTMTLCLNETSPCQSTDCVTPGTNPSKVSHRWFGPLFRLPVLPLL